MRAGLVGDSAFKVRRVSLDDAVRRGRSVSPAIGALPIWYWGLRQRTWNMVAEHYKAKGRNRQAAFRCLTEFV